MSDKSKILNKTVAANSSETDEQVIPSGETWEIQSFSGFANEARDTHVVLIWDYDGTQEIIAISHGTLPHKSINKEYTGDGIKKLALCLVNDTGDSESLGAEYEARKIT